MLHTQRTIRNKLCTINDFFLKKKLNDNLLISSQSLFAGPLSSQSDH